MKKTIFLLEFGDNCNDQLVTHLEKSNYNIMRYDIFENENTPLNNIIPLDYLIIGDVNGDNSNNNHFTNLFKSFISNQIESSTTSVSSTLSSNIFNIIKKNNMRPILGIGYGCLVLGLYYRCTICRKESIGHMNQHVIIDHRFKITRLIKQDYQTNQKSSVVSFTNTTNRLVIPNTSDIDLIIFSAEDQFDPCGFKFQTDHYGVMFSLTCDNYGKNILNNFLSHT